LLGMVAHEHPYLGLLFVGELELLSQPYRMGGHHATKAPHTARAHHATAAHHRTLRRCFLIIFLLVILLLGRHAHTAPHALHAFHHTLHLLHHTLHLLHHPLHLSGRCWHAWTGLGGLLLGRLSATRMMLFMLLLGVNTSDQRRRQYEEQTSCL